MNRRNLPGSALFLRALVLLYPSIFLGAEPRDWQLQAGGRIQAELIGVVAGNQVVLKKSEDGKSYRIPISYLSKDDQDFLKPAIEVERLKARGLIEFTVKELDAFPERFEGKQGWIDGEFEKIDSDWLEVHRLGSREFQIGFDIRTKGDSPSTFYRFIADKKTLGELLLKLQRGDMVRVEAKASRLRTDKLWLTVTSIVKIEKPKTPKKR